MDVATEKESFARKKIIKAKGDELDLDEALVAAIIKRKVLLESMLEGIQHIPDEVVDEDNACVPYGLSIMNYIIIIVNTTYITRFAHSKRVIEELLKFRMRAFALSGYYLRYL